MLSIYDVLYNILLTFIKHDVQLTFLDGQLLYYCTVHIHTNFLKRFTFLQETVVWVMLEYT